MEIEIKSIADEGNYEKERLVLKAIEDGDIGEYLVVQSGFYDESVSSDIYNAYWFFDMPVGAGDLVILYSKSGKGSQKKLKNGKFAYFFYWGLDSAIWDRKDRVPVVLHAPEWASKTPEEL